MTENDVVPDEIQPHSTRIVVWDVPATIECGETFSVTVGLKCSFDCRPDGWMVEVRDHDGRTRASATTSKGPWRDTAGLHYALMELRAPDSEGLYTWEARAPVNAPDIPHAEGVGRQSRCRPRVSLDGRCRRRGKSDARRRGQSCGSPLQDLHRRAWGGEGEGSRRRVQTFCLRKELFSLPQRL